MAAAAGDRVLLPAQPDDRVRRPGLDAAARGLRPGARGHPGPRLRLLRHRLRRVPAPVDPAGAGGQGRRRRAVHPDQELLDGRLAGGVPGRQPARSSAALTKLKSYLDYGTFQPIQIASIVALNEAPDYPKEVNEIYHSRRNALCDGLDRIGWQVEPPKGTMFVWAPIPEPYLEMGSLEFSKYLVTDAEVATSPGVGFGKGGEGFVRFALIENEQRIQQGDPQPAPGPDQARLMPRTRRRRPEARRFRHMAYWVLKIILTPVLRVVFRVRTRGHPSRAPEGSGDPGLQPPVVHRQRLPSAGGPPAGDLRGQGRVLRELEDGLVLPGRRDDPAQARRRIGVGAGPGRCRARCCSRAGCSASTRRGPVRPTAGCTRATPGAARLSMQCGAPVVPVAQFGTAAVQPIGAMWPKFFRRVEVKMGAAACAGTAGDGLRRAAAVHRRDDGGDRCRCRGRRWCRTYANRDKGRLAAPGRRPSPSRPRCSEARSSEA